MGKITKGRYTYYAGHIHERGAMNNVTIGNFCSIADGVVFDRGWNHNDKFISTYPFKTQMGAGGVDINTCKGDIVIGNDVWIGEDCLIMSGVTIGDGAVVGARSIITKDVPPYSKVVGHHRVLGKRFNPMQIKALLNIKWWEWNDEKIKENAHLLNSVNINDFIEAHSLYDNT